MCGSLDYYCHCFAIVLGHTCVAFDANYYRMKKKNMEELTQNGYKITIEDDLINISWE